jgi:AcrR family transcriptional regulator
MYSHLVQQPRDPDSSGRGRPRSKHAEEAILEATGQLLQEKGFKALTMEDVAVRAGVGKATIYRWWQTKGTLAFDAFFSHFLSSQHLVNTGTLRGDFLGALRAWIRTVKGTPTGRTLVELVGEVQRDPALAVIWRERFIGPLRDHHHVMLERAVARGEIPASTNAEVALDLLFGPAYHRLLQTHLPLTDRFARDVVDVVVAGLVAPTRTATR